MIWLALAAVAIAAFAGEAALDAAIATAIEERRAPGAVLWVGHRGEVVFRKAYGSRALYPETEPMTEDTIFDCASLTKVVATTACLMKLWEQGAFDPEELVTQHIPEFQGGTSAITLRQLMNHFSGLAPDVALEPAWFSYATGMQLAYTTLPLQEPDCGHIYSDINFELLGELIQRLSGMSLADYARIQIYLPLGMTETSFNPAQELRARIAPTEWLDGQPSPIRGVVHDPTARYMGGIAGHAGLFSTAYDLSRFAQTMLNRGELDGVRMFKPSTVELFTSRQTPPGQPVSRGFGWDIDSPYSTCRGERFPVGSYGHTGFTGTLLWIDPASNSYLILLTNAVHVKDRQTFVPVRKQVATIVGGALGLSLQASD